MLIIVDENIPFAVEAFGALGDVLALPGRQITPEAVREADALLVRSVTRVDATLLESSRVRFVGTATIGTDHVDVDWLEKRGIVFRSAPGSNAESVAEYITAALFHFRMLFEYDLRWKTIGIVGVGECGSRVERIVTALEMDPVLCDPPLAASTGEAKYQDPKYLQDCDFITIHVPLTRKGPHATAQMFNSAFFEFIKPGFGIFNAARGGVMNEMALLRATQTGRVAGATLDVWMEEPAVDTDLLKAVTIGTPHIAGYSLDGKVRATEMLYHALCDHVGKTPQWNPASVLPKVVQTVSARTGGAAVEGIVADLVAASYPIMRDDAALRGILNVPLNQQEDYFDSLRKNYPARREFSATEVILDSDDPKLVAAISAVGFRVRSSAPSHRPTPQIAEKASS